MELTRLRDVRWSATVDEAIDRLARKYPRIHELRDGWEFRLARDPSLDAYPLPNSDPPVWLIKTGRFHDPSLPQLLFLYRFDDDYVDVFDMHFIQ